ncbi:MAG: 30S ribosomal protein S5 [Patescibacteria group bacterium]
MPERESKRRNFRPKREQPEYAQQIVDIARVTRVMAGGKRMRFRVCLVIGDKKGRVGAGLGKGKDVPLAVQKAYKKAEKDIVKINMAGGTIPHEVRIKRGASKIILKPAPEGTGVIAGGACRIVLELAGVKNVVAKILGTNNKINNVKTTIEALGLLRARKPGIKSESVKTQKLEIEN